MNFYTRLLFLTIIPVLFSCSEVANTSKPNRRDVLTGSRTSTLEVPEIQKEEVRESFYNIAPWATWINGKSLSGQVFEDRSLSQADLLIEQLNFSEAQKLLNLVKAANLDQEESLVLRKASLLLLTGKPAEAVLSLSKFYQKHKLSEAQVAGESSLLFGYAYGQSRNFEQALAWFAQASESKNRLIKDKVSNGLKALLAIAPSPILEQSSYTWRLNPDLARLISEERFLRNKRGPLSIPPEGFFWMPSLSSKAFSETAAPQQLSFSQGTSLKIAALLPLSGKFSKMGTALKNGMELAAQHSQATGKNIEIIFSDAESLDTRDNLPRVISEMSQSGAEVLVGPLISDKAQEVEQIARSNSLPAVLLSKGGNASLGQGVYRYGLTNESQAESLVAALTAERPNLRAALLYPDDEFGLGFAAAVKESLVQRKITPLYDLSYVKGNQQQMNLLAKDFMLNPPEIVIFADNIKASAQFMTELDQSLKKVLIPVGSASWDNPLELIQSKSALSRAVFVSAFYPDLQDQKIGQFVSDFKTRFTKSPDFFAAQGYDLAMLLSQSTFGSEGITFPQNYQGISGTAMPTTYGEIERQLKVLQLSKGTIIPFAGLPAEKTVILSPVETEEFSDPVVSE